MPQPPYLESLDEEVQFNPITITHLGGRMNWNVEQDRTLTNQILVTNTGQDPVRFVLEGWTLQSELENLFELTDNYGDVRYVGEELTAVTTFDEVRFDRRAEASHATRTVSLEAPELVDEEPLDAGDYVDGPDEITTEQAVYEFELSSDQSEEDQQYGPSIY